jgi:hypothetical protein
MGKNESHVVAAMPKFMSLCPRRNSGLLDLGHAESAHDRSPGAGGRQAHSECVEQARSECVVRVEQARSECVVRVKQAHSECVVRVKQVRPRLAYREDESAAPLAAPEAEFPVASAFRE